MPEMGDLKDFLKKIDEEKLTFANYNKFYSEFDGLRAGVKGIIQTQQEKRKELEEEIENSIKNIQEFEAQYKDSPLYDVFEKSQLYADTLLEETTWRYIFNQIYRKLLQKTINLLDEAKGLELTKEVYQQVREIVEADRNTLKEMMSDRIALIEDRINEKINNLNEKIEFFRRQLEWSEEQFELLASLSSKSKTEIKKEYEKIIKPKEKEEKTEEKVEEKVEEKKENVRTFFLRGNVHKSFDVTESLIERIKNVGSIEEAVVILQREFPEIKENISILRDFANKLKNNRESSRVEEITGKEKPEIDFDLLI